MKRQNLIKTFFGFVLCLVSSSCGNELSHPSKPYRAEVIDHVPKTMANSEGWTVATRELTTLEDIDSLQSPYFSVNLGGQIKISSNVGSLVSAQLDSDSSRAKLRYAINNGVIVPRDTSSLLALSSFYAFEKTLKALKLSTGLEPQTLKDKLNGAFNVYFEPAIVENQGTNRAVYTLKFNAAFNPENNQFYLFRRSEIETIPFSANIKVIAHEFGHSLFKTSFHENKSENCSSTDEAAVAARREDKFFPGRWNLEYAISGINEGFSDFHSYIVSGSTNVFAELAPQITNSNRSLTGPKFTFSQLGSDSICSGRFYCIGTLFARALYNVAQQYSNNQTELMAFSRRVYAALEKSQEFMRKPPAADIIPYPTQDVMNCSRRDKPVLTYDGAITSSFLASFLQSFAAGEEKKLLCANLTELFGTVGFAPKVRLVCDA
ncbi:MAG: hypothetical protein RI932_1341 [Pseudomonadota bacterium]|jgi:hypothetical protein